MVAAFNSQEQTPQGQGSELGNDTPSVRFQTRGRHSNLYPVDLPDILDEDIKDELLKRYRTILLKDLVSVFQSDSKLAKAKHAPSGSNVSQPESLTFSLNSTVSGSAHVNDIQEDYQGMVRDRPRKRFDTGDRTKSWVDASSGTT